MYTAILMLAMTSGGESIDHGRRGCNGGCACSGYYGGGGCCSSGGYRSGYYAPGYSSGYMPGYMYGRTYYSPNVIVQGQNPNIRQSFYLDPNQQQSAVIRVMVPNTDAELWFDGTTTQQRGMDRMFYSAPLENGKYTYTIKARWMENGKAVDRERRVEVQPGQPVVVDFQSNPGERLSTPKGGTEERPVLPKNPPDKNPPAKDREIPKIPAR